ncbi:MAG: tetratricopeptide repeat protein, partial [Gemmatimonadota bacterium]|nr:tetratricopeptide repeat protein [Gemmatimonadota bacterium]
MHKPTVSIGAFSARVRASGVLVLLSFASTTANAQLAVRRAPAADINIRIVALADSGKLDEAERAGRAGGSATTAMLGEILVLRGRIATADSAYQAAIASNSPNARTAQIGLAELAMRRGDRADALRRASSLTAAYERGTNWNAADRVAAGRAYVLLGTTDKQAVHNALAAFDAAVVADPTSLEGRLRAGDLLLDKYNAPDAKASFAEALKLYPENSRALLGLARVAEFSGDNKGVLLLKRALAANPSLTPALLLQARSYLEAEAYDSAKIVTRRALAVDSSSMTAWALVGANAWLTGDSSEFKRARSVAQRLNAKPSEFYAELSEAAVRQRRYADGVRLAKQALALDSLSTRALGLVGTNELREAKMDEGRATLERAFAIDPFNLWHKNTLDLLDKLRAYQTIDKGHFRIVAPPREATLLSIYLLPLLEQAYAEFSTRYSYKPAGLVRLEIYPRHSDFSVRTVGLIGLGALGVSFGPVLAMDAPSSRERGEFNWGQTAWHELAHTFTLGSSDNRVPRWLSEGLSVAEERHARPDWGFDVTPEFMKAYADGMLRPVSQLNEGFVKPRYEAELIFSYDLASVVCEMIEAQYGQAAIVAMLRAYKDGLETPAVFEKVFKVKPEVFDKQFDAYFRKRFALGLSAVMSPDRKSGGPGIFATTLRAASAELKAGRVDSAKAGFLRAQQMFPEFAGPTSPAWFLAGIEKGRNNSAAAIAQLSQITTRNATAWDANAMEADLRETAGDTVGFKKALERLVWIYPYETTVHTRLAIASSKTGDFKTAIRERRALLAL